MRTNCKAPLIRLHQQIVVLVVIFSVSLMSVCSADNKTADEWNDEGVQLFEEEDYIQALNLFDQAIALDPTHELAWYNKGLTLKILEKYDESLESFEKSLSKNPLSADAWYFKGTVLEMMNRIDEADIAYETSDRLYEMDTPPLSESQEEISISEEEVSSSETYEKESELKIEDREFDRLYLENNPRISENLHQVTAWLKDQNWGEADIAAGNTEKFVTEYIGTLKALHLSLKYEQIRDSYIFFLRQVSIANRGISDIASLYPVYFNHGNINYYHKPDTIDYKNRLQSVITTLGTAQSELKRFEKLYY